jgi:uncharacterized protein (TIGR02594 family)
METAKKEIGVVETGKNSGSSVKKYMNSVINDGKYCNKQYSWCGGFVNWVLKNSNVASLATNDPYNPGRAFKWKLYGQKLSKPAYGAIAVMNYSHV